METLPLFNKLSKRDDLTAEAAILITQIEVIARFAKVAGVYVVTGEYRIDPENDYLPPHLIHPIEAALELQHGIKHPTADQLNNTVILYDGLYGDLLMGYAPNRKLIPDFIRWCEAGDVWVGGTSQEHGVWFPLNQRHYFNLLDQATLTAI